MAEATCSIVENGTRCDGDLGVSGAARGMCRKHYQRWWRYGDPLKFIRSPSPGPFIRNDDEARFWSKVDKRGPRQCWPWKYPDAHGYGILVIKGVKKVMAHRFAYELLIGPIPEGLTLDHLCHTNDPTCPGGDTCPHRACVNPVHLEPVTSGENVLRGLSLQAKNANKTHCKRGHPFDEENTHYKPHPNGSVERVCKTCRRLRDRTRDARLREADIPRRVPKVIG